VDEILWPAADLSVQAQLAYLNGPGAPTARGRG
jgi:hypothetical protein